jgi:phosphatidylserine/phosphatidylglycerophosphate/cardiolipin synthase-like enzyme
VGDSESVLVEGDTVWRIVRADRLAFLIDAAEYFAALREALGRAQRSVLILAWVIDSQLQLVRNGDAEDRPAKLVDFLTHVVDERPELHVRIACWDHSLIYTFDRELLTRVRMGWSTPGRLHFELDSHHPPGASLHEKVVVIDDEVAFLGGIDLGRYRWDTSAHEPDDTRRVAPNGEPYPPFHDLQTVVSGPAARVLADHARSRWQMQTGEALKPEEIGGDPWPGGVDPVVEDLELGIVRTRAAHQNRNEVRETEKLHLRLIDNAHDHVFIENQYLTADAIGRALSRRLAEDQPPAVVAVTSKQTEGWLEQVSMSGLRARWCREIRDADHKGRFGAYCPVDTRGQPVTVHSKLLTVDDRWLYHGSANLANRSMVLDSECGLAIDAAGRDDVRDAIRTLRRRLMAEHLDTTPAELAAREERQPLTEVVNQLAGAGRTLEPLPVDEQELPDGLEPIARFADPDVVPSLSNLAKDLVGSEIDDHADET